VLLDINIRDSTTLFSALSSSLCNLLAGRELLLPSSWLEDSVDTFVTDIEVSCNDIIGRFLGGRCLIGDSKATDFPTPEPPLLLLEA